MESLKFANYTPLHVFNMTTEFQMPSTCFPCVFPSFVKTSNDKHQEYIYLLLLLIMALNVYSAPGSLILYDYLPI